MLEISERASATDAGAKEAMKALRREFKSAHPNFLDFDQFIQRNYRYGEPPAQLSAARVSI